MNFDDIPQVSQPKNLKIQLFPHQLSAIYMMECREKEKKITGSNSYIETNVGIYSDITGYGKTNSMIGLIVRDKMEWSIDEDFISNYILNFYGNGSIVKYKTIKYKRINCNIIIANQSLITQWKEELLQSSLKVYVVNTRKRIEICDPYKYDVILCSPTMYNIFMIKNSNLAWKRLIFDEAGHTKIPSMKPIVTGFNWFITATPNMLLYANRSVSNNYLSSLFSIYMSTNVFKQLIVKNNDEFVRKSYVLPDTNHYYHKCYQPICNVVKGLINNNILEMISGGDIEGAVRLLGGNKTNNIYELVKLKIQEQLEKIELKIIRYERRNDNDRLNTWKDKKNRILNQQKELNSRIENALQSNCTICHSNLDKPVMLSCCQNFFCGECILSWLKIKNTCPLCRKKVETSDIIYIDNDNNDNDNDNNDNKEKKRDKTKIETIIDLICNNKEGKFIIFSSYDETFNIIRNSLNQTNISFTEIQGKISTRKRKIESFKKGKIKVLFLNSKYNGAGINLQEATDIILYHEMNKDLQTQVVGRSNRIGRTTKLNIHHLI